jgi:hypothetical protein
MRGRGEIEEGEGVKGIRSEYGLCSYQDLVN